MTRATQTLFAALLALSAAQCLNAQADNQPANAGGGTEKPAFEFVSITHHDATEPGSGRLYIGDPGRLTGKGVTAKALIDFAYLLKDFQLSGGPSWITSERYDIDATVPDAQAKLPPEQRFDQEQLMMQSLLEKRFKLSVTRAAEDLPVYALVVAEGGPKLTDVTSPGADANTPPVGGGTTTGSDVDGHMSIEAKAVSMAFLTDQLSWDVGRQTLDQTGLKGRYDFTLRYSEPCPAPAAAASCTTVFTALQEQLGLRLESTTGPVEVLVIDHIEEPTLN